MKKLISLAVYGLMLIAATACGNSRDYYSACERHNFKKAHRILHDMHEDIIKEVGSNEHCYSTAPGMYKEYITAATTVYEEEFKYLFDQESDENNPRIKVLADEFSSWLNKTHQEISDLHSKYSQHAYCLVYEREFSHVLSGDLEPSAAKVRQTIISLAKAYNNKEILDMLDE